MLDYVNAVFNGAKRKMCLPRDLLPAFEAELNGSAFDVLRRLTTGKWTVDEVRLVLEYATLPAHEASWLRQTSKLGNGLRFSVEPSAAARLLSARPAAGYAVLAALVLEAALYGISADAATFDENADDSKAA